MKKNGFLTFCFAWVPGAGQMYQGYMKRGVSLMFWFFAIIAVGVLLDSGGDIWFPYLLLPVIWAYSFFDTFNLRRLEPEQRAAMGDFFLPNPDWVRRITGRQGDVTLGEKRVAKIGGWLLIFIGAVAIYNSLLNSIGEWIYFNVSGVLYSFLNRLPGLVFAVALVALGIWLLKNRLSTPKNGEDNDDAA